MDRPGVSVSAFECDFLHSAFVKSLVEERIPEDQWRAYATLLIADLTGNDDVDPEFLEWIVRK